MSSFSDRFKQVMAVIKMSPKDAAEILQVNKSQITRWRNEDLMPRDATVNKICEKFGCAFDWLKYGNGPMFQAAEEQEEVHDQIDLETFGQIQKWLNEQEKEKTGFTNWFKIEFRNRFPEFDKWEKKKEE